MQDRFKLLWYLCAFRGHFKTVNMLSEYVYGLCDCDSINSIRVFISMLRNVLPYWCEIKTTRGIGYCLELSHGKTLYDLYKYLDKSHKVFLPLYHLDNSFKHEAVTNG